MTSAFSAKLLHRLSPSIVGLAAGDILGRLATMLAWVIMARSLGQEQFGLVSWCLAIVAYASIPADGGLGAFGTRELARNADAAEAASVRRLRFFLSLIVFSIVASVSWLLLDIHRWLVLAAAASWILPMSLNPEWLLQGRHRLAAIGALRFGGGAALLLAVCLWSPTGGGGVAGASALRAAAEVAIVMLAFAFGWTRIHSAAGHMASTFALLRQSLPMAGATLLTGLYAANFDILVLGHTRPIAEAGLYAVAFRLYLMLAVLPKLLLVPAYPRFAATGRQPASLQGEIDRFAAASLRFGLPIIVLTWTLATEVIDVVYGSSFLPAASVLRILAVAAVPLLLNAPFPSALLATGHTNAALICFAAALIGSVGMNLVATPVWGMQAAAIAVALAEFAVLILSWRACARHLKVSFWKGATTEALIATAMLTAANLAHTLAKGASLSPAATIGVVSVAATLVWGAVVLAHRAKAARAVPRSAS
jgi:lipopolysaccharide exporter